MKAIGSVYWLEKAKGSWHGAAPFDSARAFRSACLKEVLAYRPRSWSDVPWVLHNRYDRSSLHPRFVAYLDKHIEIQTWRLFFRELQHQPLQWWQDRLGEVNGSSALR